MNYKEIFPYSGNQPYIFISYSHKNMDTALNIVDRLQKDGYCVWYDEDIDPGTEWDENIAAHIDNCTCFVALLSKEYLASSNCKDELNYARTREKQRLLVYLNNVSLPSGMEMRLSRLQNIYKYKYLNEDNFYEKLYTSRGIKECLLFKKCDDTIKNQYILQSKDNCESKVELKNGTYIVGSDKRKCQIIIEDVAVSRLHSILYISGKKVFAKDMNTTNGTFINGLKIEPNKEILLSAGDELEFGNTKFVLQYLCD